MTRLLVVILENSTIIPFRWHSNKYMCFYCSCCFFESSKLQHHVNDEHRDVKVTKDIRRLLTSCRIKLDVSDIACKLCPKKLQSLEGFLAHISEVHDFAFNKEITKHIFTFKLNDRLMSCYDCDATFRFFGSLMKHVHRFHKRIFLCEICGEGFIGKRDVESHIQNKHVINPIPCNKCDNTFQSASSLRHHNDLVHKDTFKCPKCPEILKSKFIKRQHLAKVHDVKRHRFKCDQCPQVFTRNSTLVHHRSRFHLKEKTVTCNICGFKVFNNQLLKRHMIKHDGSRPYECEFCKKTFQRKKTLELHTRIHTDDRRYACTVCGKAFVQVTSLKVHTKTHHSSKNDSVPNSIE